MSQTCRIPTGRGGACGRTTAAHSRRSPGAVAGSRSSRQRAARPLRFTACRVARGIEAGHPYRPARGSNGPGTTHKEAQFSGAVSARWNSGPEGREMLSSFNPTGDVVSMVYNSSYPPTVLVNLGLRPSSHCFDSSFNRCQQPTHPFTGIHPPPPRNKPSLHLEPYTRDPFDKGYPLYPTGTCLRNQLNT